LDWPYVCIFEDDAYPIENINNELDYYLREIPSSCACLILGNSRILNASDFNDRLFNHVSSYGSQSYIVFQEYYDKYVRFLDNSKYADAFATTKDGILPKSAFFMTKKVLFI
jgi:hypothetical protein